MGGLIPHGRLLLRLCLLLLGGALGSPALAVTDGTDLQIGTDDVLWACFLCFTFGVIGYSCGVYLRVVAAMSDVA